MPSSSDEQRARWGGAAFFPLSEDDKAPMIEAPHCTEAAAEGYLRGRGYTLIRAKWQWRKPTPEYVPTELELEAIQFLIDEWDYDGIEPVRGAAGKGIERDKS